MIFINRLLQTDVGWSRAFQSRLEGGLALIGMEREKDYILYPDGEHVFDGHVTELFFGLQRFGVESMLALQYKNVVAGDKFYFMDSMQNVSGQLLAIDKDVDAEVYVHVAKSYEEFVHASYYYYYNRHAFERIMVGSKSVAAGYDIKNRSRVVGGIVNQYVMHAKEDFCLWAGYSARNLSKDWAKFVEIVEANPDIEFKACISDFSLKQYKNLEILGVQLAEDYRALLQKAKWVLSTSRAETFGYSVFDGMSYGCIPLCKNIGSYKDYLPKKYLYVKTPDFDVERDEQEIREILEPFYPANFAKRLIMEQTL